MRLLSGYYQGTLKFLWASLPSGGTISVLQRAIMAHPIPSAMSAGFDARAKDENTGFKRLYAETE